MLTLLQSIFNSDGFMPHGGCYAWTPGLVILHVASDLLIGLSYVAISTMLVLLVYKGRREIPFHAMFLAFGLFIVACGGTHFMEVWTVWQPYYWIAGGVKAVTAVASLATAFALPPLLPMALHMVTAAQLSEKRRVELEEAHAELSRLYERLKEFDEIKTQFFANVSHELRTPLTLITGPTERLLAQPSLPAETRRDLVSVRRNAGLLLRHVNDLLDVAKMASGEMDLTYTRADLAQLVRVTAANFETLAADHEVAYTVDAKEVTPAELDAPKIERVLLNLLANAFKFTPAGGKIGCSLETVPAPDSGGRANAVLMVDDSGPGVPAELREVIFERFRQVESGPSRRFGGTGLGLAIVKDFVELHGGSISVTDSPLGGARFRVELPTQAPEGTRVGGARPEVDAAAVARQMVDELTSVRPDPAVASAPAASGEVPRVLVVEDNPDMRRFVAASLGTEYATSTAVNGRDGLQQALAHPPDLVVSDVMMPEMSGDELVRALRQHRELNDVPIVLLTARDDDQLRLRMLREGAQDYLTKPFSAEELRARVGNLVALKRSRELLQGELENRDDSLEALAREIASRNRDLQQALDATHVALDHAESSSQVKTNFLRLVSHELRTPLTALRLQLQLLERNRDGSLTPRQVEILRKISSSSMRLQDLIESLLEHTRIESGRLNVEPETIDLARLVGDVVEDMRPRAQQKELALSCELPPEGSAPPLESDPRLVRLMLVNLVENALKYTERGSIDVSVTHGPAGHAVRVRDTGLGIPLEHQVLVFEPFAQLEPMRQKHTPGFGLGLTLVREMAAAVGATIELESVSGEGSTFTLVFPPREA